MTTPAGLLRWGQSGRYSAREDRQVITALAGKRAGIVTAVRLSPALGLGIAVDPGWLAIAECGDGTFAVLTSDDGAEVQAAQGGAEAREDELWAIVTDPEAAQYRLAVLPAGRVRRRTARHYPGARRGDHQRANAIGPARAEFRRRRRRRPRPARPGRPARPARRPRAGNADRRLIRRVPHARRAAPVRAHPGRLGRRRAPGRPGTDGGRLVARLRPRRHAMGIRRADLAG